MKKKISKSSPVSNRTVIGIICIVAALAICFGIAPVVNHFADRKADIVRLTANVQRGHVITETDVEVVTVGSYNLPTGLITKTSDVIGKTAGADLYAGDYISVAKLSDGKQNASDVLQTLDGTKVAVSVSITEEKERILKEAEKEISVETNISEFIRLCKTMKPITELTEDVAHAFLETVAIHETPKVGRTKDLLIDVYFKFVGMINFFN